MTERTFTGKTGDIWTWEETPEVVERHDDDIEQIERRLRYLEEELP